MDYTARPLFLPGLVLEPGDEIIAVDSRGRVVRGVFLGYQSSFIALSEDCNKQPNRFINIKRINEIIVLRKDACKKGEE